MSVPAVARCRNLIAGVISSMELKTYLKATDEEVANLPWLNQISKSAPNSVVLSWIVDSLLFYGTASKNNKENSKRSEMPLKIRQQKYFISCWLIHHRESVAMWNAYSDENGIALKFKASDLIAAIGENIDNTNENEKMKTLYHGRIVYKDFFNPDDRMNLKDEVPIIGFQKDLSFEHEKEYRFLIKQDTHNFKENDIPFVKMKIEKFKKLKFNLIFHPKMEPWKKENIKSVIKALGSKSIIINDSELNLKQW
jgi:hypothetical protein